MKNFEKFFSLDNDQVVLHPVNMGSDSWVLRNADTYALEFGIADFQEFNGVILENGCYLLQLVSLSDDVIFYIEFSVQDRKVLIEDVVCRDVYKRHYWSVMPDRGMYNL